MRSPLILAALLTLALGVAAQEEVMIRGAVYDSSRLVSIPMVRVRSTGGALAYTDSVGHYSIFVKPGDSIAFDYKGKSTNLFPVRDIRYPLGFDISLQVTVADRYKTLKEVLVVGRSYRQDSIENRERYRKAFEFDGGLTINSGGGMMGGAGLDPNSLINLFRFRRNKSMKSLQSRLLAEEAEKFVNYRFNRNVVKNITGLEGADLDRFMVVYRPSYEFAASTTEYQFFQYILDASRLFRKGVIPPPGFWDIE